MPQQLILLVDDDPDILSVMKRMLEDEYGVLTAESAEDALALLEQRDVDAVIADQMMPGMSGVELLRQLAGSHPHLTRILMTVSDRIEDARDAINIARVSRFLLKPVRMIELRGLLEGALRESELERENAALLDELTHKNRMLEDALATVRTSGQTLERRLDVHTQELKSALRELAGLAVRDGLTGLYNHRYLQEALRVEVSRSRRYGREMGLLFIDVDHFKNYNDQVGHPAGDQLLRDLATILEPELEVPAERLLQEGALDPMALRRGEVGPGGRDSDLVARYGGEEFVVLLPETPKEGALIRAERLRESVMNHPFAHRDVQPEGAVTISVGVAAFPGDADDRERLLHAADQALLEAKQSGRNVVRSA